METEASSIREKEQKMTSTALEFRPIIGENKKFLVSLHNELEKKKKKFN
jgi:DNA gyrase/topoisomerase IV subunit A